MITMSVYDEDPETGAPRGYRAWQNPPMTEVPVGRDVEPPRGPFTVDGEAGLRATSRGLDQATAQRLVAEADEGYAPGSADTLGRFVMEVRNPFTRALESGAAYKITRQDDGTYLVTETSRDERE
jgi:hypothetical protein